MSHQSVLEFGSQLSTHFSNLLNDTIPNMSFSLLKPSHLTINTMTIVCKTSLPNFITHIAYIKEYIAKNPIEEGIFLSHKSMGKSTLIFKWPQKWGENMEYQKNISAKVFSNGSVHITGVTTPFEAVLITNHISNYFGKVLQKIEKKIEKNTLSYECLDLNICMIQSNFNLERRINLHDAYKYWIDENYQKQLGAYAIFNYEKHHALHLKFIDDKTSVFIFSSGKVLITGARTPENLKNTYQNTCAFINKKYEELSTPLPFFDQSEKIPKKRGRKRKAEQMDNYDDINIHNL